MLIMHEAQRGRDETMRFCDGLQRSVDSMLLVSKWGSGPVVMWLRIATRHAPEPGII